MRNNSAMNFLRIVVGLDRATGPAVRDLCVDQEQQQDEKEESPSPAAPFTNEGNAAAQTTTRTAGTHARPGGRARHHRIERIG
jgi:hypothetical protein